jgi:cell division septum initiation protein DivIVA
MATGDINTAEQCLKAIDAIKQELANARKGLLNSETCLVNRSLMQAQLEYLEDHLPDTLPKAAEIVKEEETIRVETENKKNEILENANAQAQTMVNDATTKAQQMMEQANYEANALMDRANQEAAARVEAAKNEAARLVQEAEQKARQLVEEESVVRRARVESDELRENARQEAAELHKNTLDYIDSLLADTDRRISELVNSIRLERNEIRNHR